MKIILASALLLMVNLIGTNVHGNETNPPAKPHSNSLDSVTVWVEGMMKSQSGAT